jgi:hypothetical protein
VQVQVQVETWWRSARIIAAIVRWPPGRPIRCVLRGDCLHRARSRRQPWPFCGSPTRWRARRRQSVRSGIPASGANLETDTPCAALRAWRSAKGQRRRTPSLPARSATAPSPPPERASPARTCGAAAARSATATIGAGQPTGSQRSIPALPASTNRPRQLPTVAEDTLCRRAASASDNSPLNTANTT